MAGERAKALGGCLREAREERGWTKSETARRLGIKLPTYLRYEDGDRWPSVDLLLRASEVYNKPVGYFFAEAEAVQARCLEDRIAPELRLALAGLPLRRQLILADIVPAVNDACERRAGAR
jgi:transcriptional regulator with XRE-family HTH domain